MKDHLIGESLRKVVLKEESEGESLAARVNFGDDFIIPRFEFRPDADRMRRSAVGTVQGHSQFAVDPEFDEVIGLDSERILPPLLFSVVLA